MNARVRMVACMSLDGYISRAPGEAPNQEDAGGWTSPEDKREFRRELADADIVVAGRRTLGLMPATGLPTAMLSRRPEEPLEAPMDPDWVVAPHFQDVRDFLDRFRDKRVLLCGGAQAYDFFLRWNLVDELVLVVEPLMLGAGVPLRTRPKTLGGMDKCKFDLLKCKAINSRGTLRLDFKRHRVW